MEIDRASPVPPYRQIADHLRAAILSGELAPGPQATATVMDSDRRHRGGPVGTCRTEAVRAAQFQQALGPGDGLRVAAAGA